MQAGEVKLSLIDYNFLRENSRKWIRRQVRDHNYREKLKEEHLEILEHLVFDGSGLKPAGGDLNSRVYRIVNLAKASLPKPNTEPRKPWYRRIFR